MLTALSVLGCPQQLKTDNGPGYASSAFACFCQHLNIQHIKGIPYNAQGQGIVERAYLSLQLTIEKKGGNGIPLGGHLETTYLIPIPKFVLPSLNHSFAMHVHSNRVISTKVQ